MLEVGGAGAPIEDIDSIKKYGPRVYASQNEQLLQMIMKH